MFTFLLRKDVAETAQLVSELREHRQQLGAGLRQVSDHAGKFLGTPAGLGLSFAAGCAAGWILRRHRPRSEQIQNAARQLLPALAFARQFM